VAVRALAALAILAATACGPAAPAWEASGSRASVAPAAAPAPGSVADSAAARRHGRGDAFAAIPAGERSAVQATLERIAAGEPFPHRRDGIAFANREGRLPPEPPGYYREYTVETPGAADRGARRIVTGRGGEAYYSNDHYRSFLPLGRGDRDAGVPR
jgi:ribonuclease T1